MGFGPFSSDSKTTANSTGAADSGRVLTGKESNYIESGALQVGKGAKLKINEKGVSDFSESRGAKVLGGSDYSGLVGNVTVSSSDPTVTANAINALAGLSSQFGTTLSDFAKTSSASSAAAQSGITQALAKNAETLTQAISNIGAGQQNQIANTAASDATGGITSLFTTKPAVLIALAVLAVIAILFWRRK